MKKELIIITIILISLIFLPSNINSQSLVWNDFFTLVKNDDVCFLSCEAIFNITNPTAFTISINSNKIGINFATTTKSKNLTGLKLLMMQNISYYISTFTNETFICNGNKTCWRLVTKGTKLKYKLDFAPLPSTISFLAGKTYQFKVIGRKIPKLGENNIDWRTELNVTILSTNYRFQPPWAWWNTSYGGYTNISFVDLRPDKAVARILEPIVVNVTTTSFSLPNPANFYNGTRIVTHLWINEIPFQWLRGNNVTWAEITFLVNKSSNGFANYSLFYDCDFSNARFCRIYERNLWTASDGWNYTIGASDLATTGDANSSRYTSKVSYEITKGWNQARGTIRSRQDLLGQIGAYSTMIKTSPSTICKIDTAVNIDLHTIIENGSVRTRVNISNGDRTAYNEVIFYRDIPLAIQKLKCNSATDGSWQEQQHIIDPAYNNVANKITNYTTTRAYGLSTSNILTGGTDVKLGKRWLTFGNLTMFSLNWQNATEFMFAYNTSNVLDTNGIRMRNAGGGNDLSFNRGDTEPSDVGAVAPSFDSPDLITFYDYHFNRQMSSTKTNTFGNLSNITYEGLIRNPLKIIVGTEQFSTSTKLLFFNNRSNATLIRNGSRVRFNINWTVNTSAFKINNLVLETNITGTIKNYTNATSAYHSIKSNITNTSVRKGRFYWKSYTKDTRGSVNNTNKMFVLVDNVKPIIRVVNIPAGTLNPSADVTITDNLAIDRCWYNITEQATPNNCVGTCPTYFTCSIDPTLSGLTNLQNYRFWMTANDTSGNLNITRGNSINIFNWTTNTGGGGDEEGGGGGGGGGTTLFAIGVKCSNDVECASGICDTVNKVCTVGLCGNGLCDKDRGETFASCTLDCGTATALAQGIPGGIAGAVIIGGVVLTAFFLFKPKKKKKEVKK